MYHFNTYSTRVLFSIRSLTISRNWNLIFSPANIICTQCRFARTLPPKPRRGSIENMRKELLEGVSCQQRAILQGLNHPDVGFVSIRAGPGSGKTEVLARHAALLVANGVSVSNIVALTHTREAAKELAERINFFLKPYGFVEIPRCGTIHSFAASTLRKEGKLLPLVSPFQRQELLSDILSDVLSEEIRSDPDSKLAVDVAQSSISMVKSFAVIEKGINEAARRLEYQLERLEGNVPRDPLIDSLQRVGPKKFVRALYERYARALDELRSMDYDDQILWAISLLENNPTLLQNLQQQFSQIILDEAQDVTSAQASFVHLLASNGFFMTGDPDQMIFSFRGATGQLYEPSEKSKNQKNFFLNEGFRMSPPVVETVRATLRGQMWNLPLHSPQEFKKFQRRKPIVYARPLGLDGEVQFAVDCVNYLRKSISPRVNLNEIAIIVRTWDPYIRVLTKAITDAGFRVAPRVMLEGSFPVESFIKVLRPRERSGVAATNEDEKGTEEQHLKEIATELRRAQRRCGVKVTPPSKIKEAILTARKNFSSKNKSMFPEVVVHAAEGTGYLSVLGRCYANPRKKLVRTFAEFGDIDEMDLITQPESSQSKKGGAQPVRGINILTAHSAKGREFDAVIILGIGVSFPYYRALPKEEERLLYVAMTRARRHLALSFPQLPLNSKYEFRQVHSYGSNFFDGIVSTRALSFPGHAALVRKTVDEEESETWD